MSFYIFLAAAFIASAMNWIGSAHGQANASPPSGARDFDFLVGEWRVHHRRLTPYSHEWVEFDGTCSNRTLLGGEANMEEHALNAPSGAYRAVALRASDSQTGQWAIWWLDGRYPNGPIGPPVKGRFEKGIGSFYADDTQDGKPMRVRFLWSNITPTSARWEQSFSFDGGKTWATNWIMSFQRDISERMQVRVSRANLSDFDFLAGDWHVRHRYLRVTKNSREWLTVDGTASHRKLMDGKANMEEYLIEAPNGAYRAMALRSYDSKASQWSIWWLDGRTPHGELDPPVQGRFEKGVGTFYGNATVNGKPVNVRFIWSQITATSARWEQAYSADAGKTWETNWIMEFRLAGIDERRND